MRMEGGTRGRLGRWQVAVLGEGRASEPCPALRLPALVSSGHRVWPHFIFSNIGIPPVPTWLPAISPVGLKHLSQPQALHLPAPTWPTLSKSSPKPRGHNNVPQSRNQGSGRGAAVLNASVRLWVFLTVSPSHLTCSGAL